MRMEQPGQNRKRTAFGEEVRKRRIDGGAGDFVGALIGGAWHGAMNAAQVRGTGTQVNDESVIEEVQTVCDGERLGGDDHAVCAVRSGLENRVFSFDARLGGSADHGKDRATGGCLRETDDVFKKVAEGFFSFVGVFCAFDLDRAPSMWTVQVQSESIIYSFFAVNDFTAAELLLRNMILSHSLAKE